MENILIYRDRGDLGISVGNSSTEYPITEHPIQNVLPFTVPMPNNSLVLPSGQTVGRTEIYDGIDAICYGNEKGLPALKDLGLFTLFARSVFENEILVLNPNDIKIPEIRDQINSKQFTLNMGSNTQTEVLFNTNYKYIECVYTTGGIEYRVVSVLCTDPKTYLPIYVPTKMRKRELLTNDDLELNVCDIDSNKLDFIKDKRLRSTIASKIEQSKSINPDVINVGIENFTVKPVYEVLVDELPIDTSEEGIASADTVALVGLGYNTVEVSPAFQYEGGLLGSSIEPKAQVQKQSELIKPIDSEKLQPQINRIEALFIQIVPPEKQEFINTFCLFPNVKQLSPLYTAAFNEYFHAIFDSNEVENQKTQFDFTRLFELVYKRRLGAFEPSNIQETGSKINENQLESFENSLGFQIDISPNGRIILRKTGNKQAELAYDLNSKYQNSVRILIDPIEGSITSLDIQENQESKFTRRFLHDVSEVNSQQNKLNTIIKKYNEFVSKPKQLKRFILGIWENHSTKMVGISASILLALVASYFFIEANKSKMQGSGYAGGGTPTPEYVTPDIGIIPASPPSSVPGGLEITPSPAYIDSTQVPSQTESNLASAQQIQTFLETYGFEPFSFAAAELRMDTLDLKESLFQLGKNEGEFGRYNRFDVQPFPDFETLKAMPPQVFFGYMATDMDTHFHTGMVPTFITDPQDPNLLRGLFGFRNKEGQIFTGEADFKVGAESESLAFIGGGPFFTFTEHPRFVSFQDTAFREIYSQAGGQVIGVVVLRNKSTGTDYVMPPQAASGNITTFSLPPGTYTMRLAPVTDVLLENAVMLGLEPTSNEPAEGFLKNSFLKN